MHPYIVKLKQDIKKKGLKGLALDIDDTLAISGDYWIKGIQKEFGNPENLSVEEVKQKYRYSYFAPYWNSKKVRLWEKSIRHSHDWHLQIPIINNANHIIEQIHQIIPIVAYLTARPKSVLKATQEWLTKHNFPKAPIIYRPKNVKLPISLAWKAKVLEYMHPQILAMVDDHPQLSKDLPSNYKGTLFLYDYHDQSPREDFNVIACKNWPEVLTQIKALKRTTKPVK